MLRTAICDCDVIFFTHFPICLKPFCNLVFFLTRAPVAQSYTLYWLYEYGNDATNTFFCHHHFTREIYDAVLQQQLQSPLSESACKMNVKTS